MGRHRGGGRPPVAVRLSSEVRAELQRRVNAVTTSQRDAIRAKIVLAAADDEPTASIAQRLNVSIDQVSTWRGRYARLGLAGLSDRPRQGRPPVYTAVQRCEIVSVACEPGPLQEGLNGWTLDLLVEEVRRRGVAGVSRSHLHTILRRADLQPHRKRMWLHSPDPLFREKVADIVALYLAPPEDSTVLSIDEKTGMQAIERKYPDKPSQPGKVGKREFEYIRHGTLSLLTAFNVGNGGVWSQIGPTRTADDLERFMERVAGEVPGTVHVIWDNLNIHHGKRWEKFNERHGNRFHFHYTPLHASWVNQVELWFGILQRRCLRHGNFTSKEDLLRAVEAFVAYWNQTAKHPFRWSFTGFAG